MMQTKTIILILNWWSTIKIEKFAIFSFEGIPWAYWKNEQQEKDHRNIVFIFAQKMDSRILFCYIECSSMWYKRSKVDLRKSLEALRSEFAIAAQRVYDEWNVIPGEEIDDELAGGGICHLIAEAIADVINSKIPNVSVQTVDSQGICDQHVWVCAYDEEECYDVDISPYLYERGSGYTWKKIPGVQFDPTDISINKQRYRPESY